VLGLALGGWQLSGVLRLASETPFTVIDTGVDIDFDGFAESRPVIVDRSILNTSLDDPGISTQQLPRSAFRSVTFGDTIADIVPRAILFSLTGLTGWTWRWRRSSRCRGPDSLSVRMEGFKRPQSLSVRVPGRTTSAPPTSEQSSGLPRPTVPGRCSS
jgi:hypothetical protein